MVAAAIATVGEDTVETTKAATTRAMVDTTVISTIRTEAEVAAIKATIGETITLAGMVATVVMTATVAVTTRGMVMMVVATSEAITVRIVTITTTVAGATIAIGTAVDSGHATVWIVVAVEWMPMVAPGMEEWTTMAQAAVVVVAIEAIRGTTTGLVTKVSSKGPQ